MACRIKKLLETDVVLAEKLITAWQTDDGIALPKIPKEPYIRKMLSKDNFHAYVALEGDTVVGGLTAYELPMFDVEVHEMFLYEIGVNKAFRQQGIAKRLIEALKSTCMERNIKVIFVGTSLANNAAKQLYTTTGGVLEVIPWYTYNLEVENSGKP